MATVSLIMPAYNSGKYLRETIESIIAQTYKDWELILVNDGSKDDTLSIAEDIAQKEGSGRIKVISKPNSGVSDTRNKGIELSTGKYIMFIDSDDKVKTDYIERHVEKMESNSGDLVISAIRDTSTIVPGVYDYADIYTNRDIVWGQPWCKLFKSDIIRKYQIKFRTTFRLCEDWIFTIDYLDHIDKIIISNYVGYEWTRDNPNSLSQKCDYQHRIDCYDAALDRLEELYEHKGISDKSFITHTRMSNRRHAIYSMYDKQNACSYSLKIKRIYSYLERLNGGTNIIKSVLFDLEIRRSRLNGRIMNCIKKWQKS